jgi:hypothetical protein
MSSLTRKAAPGALLGHTQQGMIRESPVLVMCLDSVFLLVWTALAIGETHVYALSILRSYTSRRPFPLSLAPVVIVKISRWLVYCRLPACHSHTSKISQKCVRDKWSVPLCVCKQTSTCTHIDI